MPAFLQQLCHCSHCLNTWAFVPYARDCWAVWPAHSPEGEPHYRLAAAAPCCPTCGAPVVTTTDIAARTANGQLLNLSRTDPVFADVLKAN